MIGGSWARVKDLDRRLTVGALAVVALAAGGWGIVSQVGDDGENPGPGATESMVPLPSFSETPEPVEYGSLDDLAADLKARGLECTDLEPQNLKAAGHPTVKEFATCNLLGSTSLNINLWFFKNRSRRDLWLDAFRDKTHVVYGPNWIVTPQDERRALAVQGAIGGELMRATESQE